MINDIKELRHSKWSKWSYKEYMAFLRKQVDPGYRDFHSRLVPGIKNFMGIRMPILRNIGAAVSEGNWRSFLEVSGSDYYEEIVIRGIVIGLNEMPYKELVKRIDDYLPLIENWSVCDSFCSGLKQINNHLEEFWEHGKGYLKSKNPWVVRAGLVLMLDYYIVPDYVEQVLELCDQLQSNQYYVNMAQAWLVSIAYIKFQEITHEYLLHSNLDDWTYNMALQKIRESRRVTEEQKEIVKRMRRDAQSRFEVPSDS